MHGPRPTARTLAVALLGVAVWAPTLAPIAGAGAPAAPTVSTVDDLLGAIEHADDGLRALSAEIQYDKRQNLVGDQQVRRGALYFRNAPAEKPGGRPTRAFAIDFDQLMVGQQLFDDPQSWVFDGQWLVEKRPARKQFIKRRIAPPDAPFDPLRIGEGPLPIPIGQRAADIRARYEADLRPVNEPFGDSATHAAFVQQCHQLRLTPRPQFAQDEEFTEIRLWYRWDDSAGRFLPRMARTTTRSGDESYVQLINVAATVEGGAANARIPDGAFDTTQPGADAGWDVQVIDDLAARRQKQATVPKTPDER